MCNAIVLDRASSQGRDGECARLGGAEAEQEGARPAVSRDLGLGVLSRDHTVKPAVAERVSHEPPRRAPRAASTYDLRSK